MIMRAFDDDGDFDNEIEPGGPNEGETLSLLRKFIQNGTKLQTDLPHTGLSRPHRCCRNRDAGKHTTPSASVPDSV